MSEPNTNVIRDLFKNFLFVLNLSGMNVSKIPTSFLLTSVRRIFAFIILFFMSFYAVLLTKSWVSYKTWDSIKVTKISMNVWFMECTGVYVFLLYWQSNDRFINHVKMLSQATSYAGTVKYRKNLSIMTSVLFIACVGGDLVLMGVYIGFNAKSDVKEESLIEEIFIHRIYGKFLLCFTYFYTLLAYTTTSAIFLFFCTIDTVEFMHLNYQIKQEKVLTVDTLKSYFIKHTKLVCAVDQLNETFCYYIFIQICGVIPLIILYIYGFFTQMFLFDFNTIPWVIVLCIMVFVFTLGPAAINCEAAEMVDIVYQKTEFYNLDKMSEMYQIISWFALQSANKPAGITIGKFFLITNSFLLSAISLIITYVTLLLDTGNELIGQEILSKNETV